MKYKELSELVKSVIDIDAMWDCRIKGVTLDSREVKPGDLFFACTGYETDGRNFIDAAIAKGAVAVISDTEKAENGCYVKTYQNKRIPVIEIKNLKQHISDIAAAFFDHPSRHMTLIGITGTNGKTSCCHFIAQALARSHKTVGVLGTVGNGIWGSHKQSQLTTPDPVAVQRLLAEFYEKGATYVVMEASSHGLAQGRMNAIDFDIAVFTNLTRDHLDYHGDMRAYGSAKQKLFQALGLKYAVINNDDDFGRYLLESLHPRLQVYGYSAAGRLADQHIPLVRIHQAHLGMEGLTASLHSPWGDGLIHTKLIGRFNLSNLLVAATVLGILEYPIEDIINLLSTVEGVPGRMELFTAPNKPYVIVDYAHTPDALRQVLLALKEFNLGELWCVFGCGGNRDQGKRAQMGQIAESFADHVIITDDNPRFEQPQAIAADILQGMARPELAVVEHDRRRAIAHALSCATEKDIVLIAGKGHETYQQYGEEKRSFNDRLEAQMILAQERL